MFLRELEKKECLNLEYLCFCSLLAFSLASRDSISNDCSLARDILGSASSEHLSDGECLCLPFLGYLSISLWIFLRIIILSLVFMVLHSECSSTDSKCKIRPAWLELSILLILFSFFFSFSLLKLASFFLLYLVETSFLVCLIQ